MPTYEYVCEKCGHAFEKSQSMSEKPLTVCPKDLCARKKWAKGRVKRQVSGGGGLLFKGSGFYITDYRSENYKQAAKKETGAATPSSTAGTTDTKAAPAKTETTVTKPKSDKS